MSNHNYKQYYNKANEEQKPVVEPEVIEPVVEPEIVEPEVVEPEAVQPTAPVTVDGKVVKCKMLNVRIAPRKDADVLAVVDCGAKLVIDVDRSLEDWYSVCTVAGIEGYCMKEFVEF